MRSTRRQPYRNVLYMIYFYSRIREQHCCYSLIRHKTPSIDHFCWRVENALIKEGGFGWITGEPGTGKSVCLRILDHRLSQMKELSVAVLSHPSGSLGDFYRQMGDLFSVDLKPSNRWGGFKLLRDRWIAHQDSSAHKPILLVDEAQEMSTVVMNELRLLSSIEFDSKSALTTVLAGDARLANKFQHPDLLPLASRMRVRLQMTTATPQNLLACISHVMEQAGNKNLVTKEVIENLADRALGNYRALCTLANELLMEGARQEASQIDSKLFMEVFGALNK